MVYTSPQTSRRRWAGLLLRAVLLGRDDGRGPMLCVYMF